MTAVEVTDLPPPNWLLALISVQLTILIMVILAMGFK